MCPCSLFSVLTKIIKSGYAALQLEYFFTAGPDEVRAWTIRVSAQTHAQDLDFFNVCAAIRGSGFTHVIMVLAVIA